MRPSPLRSPLLSTVGTSSYYQLWPDVDLAVTIFQAAMRRVITGTAFDVSATLRDALCRGIVNRFPRRSTGEARSPRRPVGCSPRTGAALPLRPCPRESWDPNPLASCVGRPRVALRRCAMDFVSLHHGHTRGTLCFSLAPSSLAATPAILRCSRNPSTTPLVPCLAAAGHLLPSRYNLPCPNTPRRPRPPPPQLPKLLEAGPSAGGHSPRS